MSQLNVDITGNAASFNKTLQTAKTDAAKFNQQLVSQSKQTADANRRVAASGQFVSKGFAAANAASMLSGVPGTGQAGAAIAGAVNAFIGLKETAAAFGVTMLKAGGVLAAFAFAIGAWTKLYKEAYGLVEVLTDQLDSEVRASQAKAKADNAYIDVLKQNRSQLKAGDYERLRRGVLTGDRGALQEIRSRFGGTELNKELAKELVKAQIDAMPDGAEKKIAQEKYRFDQEAQALRDKVGSSPSQATQRVAAQIYAALQRETNNNIAEIQKQQLNELKSINSKTEDPRKYGINPFK